MNAPARPKRRHYWVYGLLVILFVLHHDFMFWDLAVNVAGLPIGLAYDMVYTVICACTWGLVILLCWPSELETFADAGDEEGAP
ncbi:MAG: hypothetical protein AAGK14_09230 [Verrucomicrobiota bacterium]